MKSLRPWVLMCLLVLAVCLAYLGREVVHDWIVLPLAYWLWQLRGLLAGVAELVQWGLLVAAMALVMAWQLVPRLPPRSHRPPGGQARQGAVDLTAICLRRARSSNYFRWQLAHRLGSAASSLRGLPPNDPQVGGPSVAVMHYLDAGMNYSFVDYAVPRFALGPPAASPLDLEPAQVVQYLESHLMQGGGGHADSS